MFLKAETFGQLPSRLLKIANDLAAYQLDNAVLFFGLTIKNALAEQRRIGNESMPKYSLTQLLDPDFRLSPHGESGIEAMASAYPGVVGHFKQVAANGA